MFLAHFVMHPAPLILGFVAGAIFGAMAIAAMIKRKEGR